MRNAWTARGWRPAPCGKRLINLDTEEWGHFYLGCAGGVDVEVRRDCKQEDVPPGYVLIRLEVSGLRGGHSGIDIHLGRGNAIKLLAEALRDLSAHTDLQLIKMQGGTARNAIPREAFATCALPIAMASNIDEWVRLGMGMAPGLQRQMRVYQCLATHATGTSITRTEQPIARMCR